MKLCKKCEKNEDGCKCGGEKMSLKKEAPVATSAPSSTPPATGPTLGAMIGFPGAAQTAPINKSEMKPGSSYNKQKDLEKSREAARQVKEQAIGGIKAAVEGVKAAAGWVAHQTKADIQTIGEIAKNPSKAKSALRGRLHRFANETKGTKGGSVDVPPSLRKIEPGMSFNELKKHDALIGKIHSLQKAVADTKDKELLQKALEAVDDILEGGLLKKKGE